jgi:hypothetical protein
MAANVPYADGTFDPTVMRVLEDTFADAWAHRLHVDGRTFGWLPFLLLYLVWRLGYDGRALPAWTVVACALVLISFFLMPQPRSDPGLTPVNIDYVWGFSDTEAQHWMPPAIWVAALMILLPALPYVPVHFLLHRLMPNPMRAW